MENPLFSFTGLYQIFRWVHYLAGVTWIGHLYYFNFVQGTFFAKTDAQTKSTAIRQLVPEALWWFRWGAAFTFLTGVLMLWQQGHIAGHAIYSSSWGVWILTGAAMGTLMAYNVWFVIWPAQKVVIASAEAVASGGAADPTAAARGARALMASRTNTLFSIPMLFFMGAASHLGLPLRPESDLVNMSAVIAAILIVLEANALFGKKTGPLTTVRGVITSGLLLTVLLYGLICSLV